MQCDQKTNVADCPCTYTSCERSMGAFLTPFEAHGLQAILLTTDPEGVQRC